MAVPNGTVPNGTALERCAELPPLDQFNCIQEALEEDPQFANYSSCDSGSLAIPLSNNASVPPGMYSPLMDENDESTYPQFCPATFECQLLRLGQSWCDPQGPYEPTLCEPGYYCPNASTRIPCPAGTFCVRGSAYPRPCSPMTHCPPGTQVGRHYGGTVIAVLIDLLLVALFTWHRRLSSARQRRGAKPLDQQLVGSSTKQQPVIVPNPLALLDGGSSRPVLRRIQATIGQAVDAVGAAVSGVFAPRKGAAAAAGGGASAYDAPVLAPQVVAGSRGARVSQLMGKSTSKLRFRPKDGAANDGSAVARIEEGTVGVGKMLPRPLGRLAKTASSSSSDSADASPGGSGGMPSALLSRLSPPVSSATMVLEAAFRKCNAGLRINLEFEELRLTIPPPVNKTILKGVSGRITSGRVTAIMGPSGAGKTTFLSVIMGKTGRSGGTLRINGRLDEMSAYKRATGFVPQEDIMMRELTVRENILFSARVRLPRQGWPDAAIQRFVAAVIEVLGLNECADTPTGLVSGGQRKRCNIGMELAMAPTAIFLDEPTSGLDSSAALEVCRTLRSIADLGLTVVAVIHQPREEIFRSFDDLLLLAPGGHTVYMGPQAQAMDYFKSLGGGAGGSECDASKGGAGSTDVFANSVGNPADALLDLVAGQNPLLVTSDALSAAGFLPPVGAYTAAPLCEPSPPPFINPLPQHQLPLPPPPPPPAPPLPPFPSQPLASPAGNLPPPPPPVAVAPTAASYLPLSSSALVELRGVEVGEYLAGRWASYDAAVNAAGRFSGCASSEEEGGQGGGGRTPWKRRLSVAVSSVKNLTSPSSRRNSVSAPSSSSNSSSGKAENPLASVFQQLPSPSQLWRGRERDSTASMDESVVVSPVAGALAAAAAPATPLPQPHPNRPQPSLPSAIELPGMTPPPLSSAVGGGQTSSSSPSSGSSSAAGFTSYAAQRAQLDKLMEARGASFWRQLWLCHQRSMLQQLRQGSWLASELVVCVLAGVAMGTAATVVDELYIGILRPPYTVLSPAPSDIILVSFGFYINMALGVAGSPAAVRTFGEERDVFLRENRRGHSALAYFIAKNLSVMPRLILAALHFGSFFTMLARPTAPFPDLFLMMFLILFGVYGLSTLVSMLVSRQNAALVGVIVCLICACMCGYGPNLNQGRQWGLIAVQNLSYSRWATEVSGPAIMNKATACVASQAGYAGHAGHCPRHMYVAP